jgi:nitroimidazol reductase NimA-like FMN-containing flavoprotein (pyridoxamine 5'-phosphate oxidase superfamily)
MRKKQREITDIREIADVLNNIDAIHLGINDEGSPYVVPVSFGYELKDDKLVFYFHGARIGKKAGLLDENPQVCIEGDNFHRYQDTIDSVTCFYESVIAYGRAEKLDGEEAMHGIEAVLDHCGYAGHFVNEKYFPAMNVYRVVADSVTGKYKDRNN